MTLDQLNNWIKVFVITDIELKPLPLKLVEQLSKSLRKRWISLNKDYYASL